MPEVTRGPAVVISEATLMAAAKVLHSYMCGCQSVDDEWHIAGFTVPANEAILAAAKEGDLQAILHTCEHREWTA